MALIELPRAGGGSVGTSTFRGGVGLPDAGDVPRVRVARDPGLRVPDFARHMTGLGDIGAALQDVGETLARREEVERRKEENARNRLELSAADTAFLTTKTRLETEFDGDADFATQVPRYAKALSDDAAQISQGITDPTARQLFLETAKRNTLLSTSRFSARVRVREGDATVAELNARLSSLREQGLGARDGETRQAVIETALNSIKAVAARGFIDATTAEAVQRKWLEDFGTAVVLIQSPEERIELLTGEPQGVVKFIPADDRARLRRQAEAEAEGLVRGDVSDAIKVLEAGRTPANLEIVQELAEGTKFEATLAEAVEDREAVDDFLKLSIPAQAAKLTAAPDVTDRRALSREGRMTRAHTALRKSIENGHGLTAAAELDVISPVTPIDLSDESSLLRRGVQAMVASRHFGMEVSPLLPAEADAIAAQVATAPADAATGILEGLVQGFGRENAMAFVSQIAVKQPELAFATVNVADRPLLAREIISGGRLLRKNRDVAPEKTDRLGAIASVFGTEGRSVFNADTATALRPILDAATALYAARRVPGGDFSYDEETFETALEEVVGGIFLLNGRNLISPVPGMDEDAFEDLIEGIDDTALIEHGNGPPMFDNGRALNAADLRDDAQLVTSGFGTYLVFFPGLGYAMTATTGQPYEIDLGAMIRGAP